MLQQLRSWWRRWRSLGARAERAAARMLRGKGYRIHGMNLRNRMGEIDILAEDRTTGQMVLVEVKSGTDPRHPPELHVDDHKQRKLTALAGTLLRRLPADKRAIRFDVVGIVWPAGHRTPTRITHHPRAFEPRV